MENIVIKGTVTNTSNKSSDVYKGEVNSKTAYLYINEEYKDLATKFGVKFYTPKDGGDEFAVIKTSKVITLYEKNDGDICAVKKFDSTQLTKNFRTSGPVMINLIKGEKASNEFIRLQAILLENGATIEKIEADNPFKNFM